MVIEMSNPTPQRRPFTAMDLDSLPPPPTSHPKYEDKASWERLRCLNLEALRALLLHRNAEVCAERVLEQGESVYIWCHVVGVEEGLVHVSGNKFPNSADHRWTVSPEQVRGLRVLAYLVIR